MTDWVLEPQQTDGGVGPQNVFFPYSIRLALDLIQQSAIH